MSEDADIDATWINAVCDAAKIIHHWNEKGAVFVDCQNAKQNQQQNFRVGLRVILWICKVIESAFMGDTPPSMHVIAFSDLDHFLGRLLCSSSDATHHCPTLMAEFSSKCDYRPLCVVLEHCVGWNYPLSILALENKVVQKEATMFLSFLQYTDNSDMLHVEWRTTEYGSLCYTMVAISAQCPSQNK